MLQHNDRIKERYTHCWEKVIQMKFEIKTKILCATIVTAVAFFTITTIQVYNTTIIIIEIHGSCVNFSGEYHGWFLTTITLIILLISLSYIAK